MRKALSIVGAAATVPLVLLATAPTGATAATGTTRLTTSLQGRFEFDAAGNRSGDIGGAGFAAVRITGNRVCYGLTWKNIAPVPPFAAHIHEAPPGVPGPIVIPLFQPGLPAPNISATGAHGCVTDETGAAARVAANPAGFYVNVHTTEFPGGAIRGQLSDTQVFVADMKPLNANAALGIPASDVEATVTVKNLDLTTKLDVTGVAPNTTHLQHIHAGPSCPTQEQDADGNGVVDFAEGLPNYGGVVVNLDSTLNNLTNDGTFPTADASGSYSYSQTGNRDVLDSLVPADFGGTLLLGVRAIVVHGVDASLQPKLDALDPPGGSTVSLPVACGKLRSRDLN